MTFVDCIKWALIDTTAIMIPFGIFLYFESVRNRKTDEFIKRHFRL